MNWESNSHKDWCLFPWTTTISISILCFLGSRNLSKVGLLAGTPEKGVNEWSSWLCLDTRKAILWKWAWIVPQASITVKQAGFNQLLSFEKAEYPSVIHLSEFYYQCSFLNLLRNPISLTKEIECRLREEVPMNPPIHHHYHHDAICRQRYTWTVSKAILAYWV